MGTGEALLPEVVAMGGLEAVGAPGVRTGTGPDFAFPALGENPEAGQGIEEWALLDSNQGPIGYEPTALTAELRALNS